MAMTAAGMATTAGLEVVAGVWRDFEPSGQRWNAIKSRNLETVTRLNDANLSNSQFTQRDADRIVRDWTFPLHSMDMNKIDIDLEDLRKVQKRVSGSSVS